MAFLLPRRPNFSRKIFHGQGFIIIISLSMLVINGQPNRFNFGHFSPDEALTAVSSSMTSGRTCLMSNCALAAENQLLQDAQQQHEREGGKLTFPKFLSYAQPQQRQLDGQSTSRFVNYRYFLPGTGGGYRDKKAQKAILLDVGDYVVKGNGSPIESGIGLPSRNPASSNMGGILRSSGK